MAEMVMYKWAGINKAGKKVNGQAQGKNENQVRASLRQQGVRVTSVKKASTKSGGAKITSRDIMVFIRQMATMMTSGVPLVQSLDIIGEGHDNPKMRAMVLGIKGEIEAGATMAAALQKYPEVFDDLAVNLVAAGEQSGALEAMLKNLAVYREKTETLKGKIKKAMFYPVAVVIVAMVVSTILLVFVVPQFATIFDDLGAELPAITAFIVKLSNLLQSHFLLFVFGAAGFVVGFAQAKKRSEKFAYALDRLVLRLPIAGEIATKAVIARFARTMSIMFASGTPLVESMVSVAGACGNRIYRDATMQMRDEVSTGTRLQLAMSNTALFPSMVVQMVAIGEEAGSLETMLGKVADSYEEEVDLMVDSLSSLMEPVIIVFLGGLIGTLVVAMYMPIFKLSSAV